MALHRAYPRRRRHKLWLLPFALSFATALGLAQCYGAPIEDDGANDALARATVLR